MVVAPFSDSKIQYGKRKNIYKKALSSLYNKKEIWEQLKKDRLLRQEQKTLNNSKFTFNKKIYIIDNIKYYKVLGLGKDYYIETDALGYTSSTQMTIQLCYYTINGMKSKRSLLKIEDKSKDKIYISISTLKIIFHQCKLEDVN